MSGSFGDFTAQDKLEIFKGVDLKRNKDSSEDQVLGTITSDNKFTRASWGNPVESMKMGILATATIDGLITLYDPSKIIDPSEATEKGPVISTIDKHTSSIRGLEFNPSTPVLASAGEDSQLYIWNMKNPEQPTTVSLGGRNPHQDQLISHLAWNRIFEYILATTSYNGTSVIWDLKAKKFIMPLNSAHKARYSSVAWNPEEATQLVLACEDDNRPVVELWDLRNAYEPVKTFEGHTRGVLSVSWCPDDSNLLISAGRDHRSIIWNPNSGEMLGELPVQSTNWMYDVQWSRRPSILSASSLDGVIGVYSLQDSSSDDVTVSNDKFKVGQQPQQKQVFKTAPKWLQRPCGATFGFGGRIATFNKTTKQVHVHAVASDNEFGRRSLALERALSSTSPSERIEYCNQLAKSSADESEAQIWNVLHVLFETDRTKHLLGHLGLKKDDISEQVNNELTNIDQYKLDAFTSSDSQYDDEKIDQLVRKCVMVQNYSDAVQVCLKANRLSDALVISTFGGTDLYNETRRSYFEKQTRSPMKTVVNILNQEFETVIERSNLDEWKETLAELCSCPDQNQFAHYCNLLARRLESRQDDSALVCYLLANQPDKCLEIWLRRYESEESNQSDSGDAESIQESHRMRLVRFIEKVAIYQESTRLDQLQLVKNHPDLAIIYKEYAQLLSAQGQSLLPLSLHYLNLVSSVQQDAADQEVMQLRHRVYHAVAKPQGNQPELPWKLREPKAVTPQQPSSSSSSSARPQPTTTTTTSWNAAKVGAPVTQPPQQTPGGRFINQPPQQPGDFGQPQQPYGANPHPLVYGAVNNATHQPLPPSTGGYHVPQQTPGGFNNIPPQQTPGGFNNIPQPGDFNNNNPPQQPGAFVNQPPTLQPFEPANELTQPPVLGTSTGEIYNPLTSSTGFNNDPYAPSSTASATSTTIKTQTVPVKKPLVNRPSAAAASSPSDDKLIQVDLSSIDAKHVPIVEEITIAFESAFQDNAPSYVKSKKRIVSNSVNDLFQLIKDGTLSAKLADDLVKWTNALKENNQKQAEVVLRDIAANHWKEVKDIHKGLKFLSQASIQK
ncbi:COPII adaptor coat protein SEC31 [Acrasis kona]|uniref:COPII adaptor coat protein SEC31 n=1 Tax=Acrasis kona TaxID=1008807 RepID=A0AAW2Z799_9EUKA